MLRFPLRAAVVPIGVVLGFGANAELPAVAPPNPLTLAWCLERAASANPDIAIQAAEAEAAQERVASAGRLEDPRFSYEASNLPVDRFDFSSTPLSGHQLFLRQKLPIPALLGNEKEAARAGADAAVSALTGRQVSIAADVEAAWAELGFMQRALQITEQNIVLLRQIVEVAEAKYRVGEVPQQDVLRAQVELTALLTNKLQREAARDTADARLVSLLDLLVGTPRLPTTASLNDASDLPRLAPLLADLDQTSPVLRARQARLEEARRLQRIAELEGYPDVDVDLGYRIRRNVATDPVHGEDFFSAGVTVRLPVDRVKWRSRVAERVALVRREEAALRGARADLNGRIQAAFSELTRADAESKLLTTGLVPQARQSLAGSRSGYEVGRVDLLSLLDSQVRLFVAELGRVRALADRRLAYSALEAAVGVTLR